MAGYDGHSMSNNARDAYASGKLPASKLAKELTSKHYNRTDFYLGTGDAMFWDHVEGFDCDCAPDWDDIETHNAMLDRLIIWMKAWQSRSVNNSPRGQGERQMDRQQMIDALNKTGYDAGDEWSSEQEVRDYFSVEAQLELFGDQAVTDHDTLDAMAQHVIDNRLHCAF